MVAMGLMGVSGIVFNIMVGRSYAPAVLGIFNQVFAIHMVVSQMAVGGIHLSILKHIPELAAHPGEAATALRAALGVAALLGGAVCVVLTLLAEPLARLLESPSVHLGLLLVVPGIWLFGLNKVLLLAICGAGHLKSYALLSGTRYVLILLFLLGAIGLGVEGDYLPGVLTLSELFLLLPVGARTWWLFRTSAPTGSVFAWSRRHMAFGARAFFSNLAIEVNARVDILLLGVFLPDRMVGIYSFAALFTEGMLQFSSAMRQVVSPRIAVFAVQGEWAGLAELIRRMQRHFVPVMAVLCLVAWLLFAPLVEVLLGSREYLEGEIPFAILMLGVVVGARALPFQFLLNQCGFPGQNALLMMAVALTKAVGNLVLIPVWGLEGAALGTVISLLAMEPYLRGLTRRSLGVDLWRLHAPHGGRMGSDNMD